MSAPLKGSGGYILLWRKLLEHALMLQLPAAWFRIFIAILLKVNWKPGTWWDGRQEVPIPAGSMVTSVQKLCKLAMATPKQVRGCLGYLQAANIVAIKTTSHWTLITVLNWETYQNPLETEGKPNGEAEGKERASQGQSEGKAGATIESGNQGIKESGNPTKKDLDCSPGVAKERDTRASVRVPLPESKPKPYPKVRERLARYMVGHEKPTEYPTDRCVVDCMNATGGATEDEVLEALRFLYNERGLKPGTRNGPRRWSWFKTVLYDHFEQIRARHEAASPSGFGDWEDRNYMKEARERSGLTKQQFDAGIDAFDTADEGAA